MRRWIAGTALLTLLGTGLPARAAPQQGRAFEVVPFSSWSYATVRRLEVEGYSTGSPEGTFSGRRKLTRYEFAVAVERVYRGLQSRVLSVGEPGHIRADVNLLRELLREFGPEIGDLGIDVPEIRREVVAMEDRLSRLESTAAPGASTYQPAERPKLLTGSGRAFGLRRALERPLRNEPFPAAQAEYFASVLPGQRPSASTGLGPLVLGVSVLRNDPLGRSEKMRFEDPASRLDYRAELGLPLGRCLVSAFYDRESGLSDSFGLTPYLQTGPLEGVGGSLRGSLLGLGLSAELATLRPQEDDLSRLLYFRGGVRAPLGGGFSLGLGYERTWFDTPGWASEFSTYTAGIGRSFGKNAELRFQYRYTVPGKGFADPGEASNSSAITQISVRF